MIDYETNPQKWLLHRHYNVPPEGKTIEACRSHGADHRAYGWGPQVDPRWSDEQKAAYWKGFKGE